MERPRRYCTNCGARLTSRIDDTSPAEEMPEPVREWGSGYTLPRLQVPEPGRDALMGLGLALSCAALLVAATYAWLAIRGTFSDSTAPVTIGLALYALLNARISDEADRKAIEHLIDTFKVKCSLVTSQALASPSASLSASASSSASAEAQAGRCSDPGDTYSQGVVVGDDTPDCARPEDVLESGLCRTP